MKPTESAYQRALNEAFQEFKNKYKASTSADWQTFLIGFEAGYNAAAKDFGEEDVTGN